MTQAELKTLPSGRLFEYCASHYDDDRYWNEFVQRFNSGLTSSVFQTYRRFSVDGPPSTEAVSDLLQEVYLKILNDKCAILQRFRGGSEFEAEVYLMHIATNVTIDHLRRQRSLKRRVRTESIDKAILLEELRGQREHNIGPYTDEMAENDVVRILKGSFKGKNRKRNILIFLLHYREGLTPREIAEVELFELSPSSVSHILAEMREMIRNALYVERAR